MARTETSPQPISEKDEEVLEEYQDILSEKSEEIKNIFNVHFSSERNMDKFDVTGDSISWLLQGDGIEDKEIENIINAIFNVCINFNADVKKVLRENEYNPEVVNLLESIAVNHNAELNRQANRATKGKNWWSDISTTISYRDGTLLSHEFTIDMEEKVTVSNDIFGSHLLARHILQQTKSARNVIGEDVLENVNEEILEDIKGTIDDILEDVEQYDEQIESGSIDDDVMNSEE